MKIKLTRRQLAAALAPAALATAQQPAPAEDLQALARGRIKSNADALNAVKLPMATEPASQFRA